MRIIVEGLIGVGKSTFTKEASRHFNLTPMYESVEDNPFLEKFYSDDPSRWAYTLQMHFLYDRFSKHLPENTLLDRSIFGDICFANILKNDGVLTEDEHSSYLKHFNLLKPYIPHVDVCIHLHVSVEQAMERISKRGRDFEAKIPESYLHKLQAQVMQIPEHLPSATKYIKIDWYDMDEAQRLDVIRGLL
jgi:deoxyadenosine/deoxycytidine kinase